MPFVQTRVSSQFYSPFRVHPGRCNKRQSVFDIFFSLEAWIRCIYIYIFFNKRMERDYRTFFRTIQTRNFRSM